MTFLIALGFTSAQLFSIGTTVWLSQWSDASEKLGNNTMPNNERDMYLGVYGALGLGQSKYIHLYKNALGIKVE